LDLGVLAQAHQAALLLGDMGATVIKVELPGIGDQSRWIPATFGHAESGYWIGCNRGKKSVTIDLRKPEGRDVFLRLADTADVVVSNFKPGTLDEWGLGYEVLAARNPRVIYATGVRGRIEGIEC
jgi:formyl-CoA transferase